MKHDYFSPFNQSDRRFLALSLLLWPSLFKRPICQRLGTRSFLRRKYCFALLCSRLTRQGGAKTKKRSCNLSYCLQSLLSFISRTLSSVCYKPAFNKLKPHVIELDKVKELIYRSFLWTFSLVIGSSSLTIMTSKRARTSSKNDTQPFCNHFWSYLAC